MQRYLGLDAHAKSCTLAVIDAKGKRLNSVVLETSGRSLVEAIKLVPRPRALCLEEGTQSAWLHEILSPHVDALVVTCVLESRGPKDDRRDAFALADTLRLGTASPVFKDKGSFRRLRSLSGVYNVVTVDVARTKNRLKGIYRSRALPVASQGVYSTTGRESCLPMLPAQEREAVELLYRELDALVEIKTDARTLLLEESHRHAIARLLETAPGLGPVRVAQLMPIVVTPHRFRTARQFWSYSGLGIMMRTSSDWVPKPDGGWTRAPVAKTRGLSRAFNRQLKAIFKGAATTVITHRMEPLHAHYERMTQAGTKPPLAKLTVARKIAAAVLAMWKNKEAYDPKRTMTQS